MVISATYIANWRFIYERCRRRQLQDNDRENKSHIVHEYKVSQLVSVTNTNIKRKLTTKTGPFKIVAVHSNGTVTIQHSASVVERLNLCHICPVF
eukprot:12804375-Ditylum_brightwellii.AAC.1